MLPRGLHSAMMVMSTNWGYRKDISVCRSLKDMLMLIFMSRSIHSFGRNAGLFLQFSQLTESHCRQAKFLQTRPVY
ncbi:hypothetical protein XELAEV_18031997mg [Xenopus laevis]|uniref:Uncharacterized protein n=1 Tax=Xenopus laevis TaxID=8355 RepID=A0A974CNT3_XENLA|nr:hypothetical protein XELAEV_18031997mg [Xenopus laevis]